MATAKDRGAKADFGVIGLGVMGSNLALNVEEHGSSVALWNLEPEAVDSFARKHGGKRFVSESWAELKKVDWPGQHQLVQGTAVVLIACLVTGVYLFLADELFRRFVQHVLLGG